MKRSYCQRMISIVVFFVLVLWTLAAQAIPITVEFSASNFTGTGVDGSSAPPESTLSGSIVYDAVSTTATIDSLLSINLTIAGHTYELDQIGFDPDFHVIGDALIGATHNPSTISFTDAPNSIRYGTDDFWLRWNLAASTPLDFAYSASGTNAFWRAGTFDSFRIFESPPVPEPATMMLFGIGLLGIAGMSRKK